ncbi:MAG: gephyrin-like molybdotransferase Glp [Hyphomicrobiaceae bacterium]
MSGDRTPSNQNRDLPADALPGVPRLIDDCFRPDDPSRALISHQEAIDRLRSRLAPVAAADVLPTEHALGRILAADMIAPFPVPAVDNSAVDGFAVGREHAPAVPADGITTVRHVVGVAKAGHPFERALEPGEAVRILTGAPVPEGTEAVVMREDTAVTSSAGIDGGPATVSWARGHKPGANIRRAGEDVAQGTTLFPRGHIIRPQDIAALATIGIDRYPCYRPLRVAIVSTGDELVPPASAQPKPPRPGHVYDANSGMLAALVTLAGAMPERIGIVEDRPDVVRHVLADVARRSDVIITSGGASDSSEDHVASTLATLGRRHEWWINIKPGRPVIFGQIGATVVAGLPGNPVAVFVCFLLYVFPMLRTLGGAPWPEPTRLELPAAFTFQGRKVGRREYWRGWLEETEQGLVVQKFPRDGSGLVSGLRAATGLIEVSEAAGDVHPGTRVTFIPFTNYGFGGL